MEELFINKTKYTKEEIRRFKNFHKSKYQQKKLIGILFFFVIIAIMIVINIINKNLLAVVALLILAFLEYIFYFKIDINRKKDNNAKKMESEFTFIFTKKYIEIESNQGKEKLWYQKIYRAFETKFDFYLYLNKEYAIIINKDGFVKGNTVEFKKFLKEKLKIRAKL